MSRRQRIFRWPASTNALNFRIARKDSNRNRNERDQSNLMEDIGAGRLEGKQERIFRVVERLYGAESCLVDPLGALRKRVASI